MNKTKRITTDQIKTFCQCPALLSYSRKIQKKPVSLKVSIPQQVIQYAYLYALENNTCITWKQILQEVNHIALKTATINTKDDWIVYRQQVTAYLNVLTKWYNDIYIKEALPGMVDIDIPFEYRNFTILVNIPILKQSDPYTLIYFKDKNTGQNDRQISDYELFNNLDYRLAALAICQFSHSNEVKIQQISISIDQENTEHSALGGETVTEITLDETHNHRLYNRLDEILLGMEKGFKHPVFSNQCKECPFKRRCRL